MNQVSPPKIEAHELADEQEISLLDILRFLKSAYKTILIFGVIGLLAAIAYLVIAPQQYEATAQIAMAQIGAANNNNNNNLNPLGINVEDPTLLIARLGLPSSYTPEAILACAFEGKPEAGAALVKSIKLSIPKGVANVVELKTVGDSPKQAIQCADAIMELIKTTQNQILIPYIEEAKQKLAEEKARLQAAQQLISRSDKSGSGSMMGAVYLSTRDEINYLLDKIAALNNVVSNNQNRATRLITPIYASDLPISPKKRIALAAGLFGGLFLGLLIALAGQMITKLKSEMAGAA
jgi:capsular polysaccharide biosynthesis protein